ncbi:hypothetical protein ACQJBY_039413 [Aegilops geniculata]
MPGDLGISIDDVSLALATLILLHVCWLLHLNPDSFDWSGEEQRREEQQKWTAQRLTSSSWLEWGEAADEGSVASSDGSEAVAEEAAGGKGGRRGSCGPRRGRAANEGAADHSGEGRPAGEGAVDRGGEGRRRCGRRRSPAKGSSDGGEAWRRGGATEEEVSRSISNRG